VCTDLVVFLSGVHAPDPQSADTQLVQMSLELELAEVNRLAKAKSASEALVQASMREDVRAWSEERFSALSAVLPRELSLSTDTGAAAKPFVTFGFDYIEWVPPGSQIAEMAMSSRFHLGQGGLTDVTSAWDAMHQTIRVADLAKLGKVSYEGRTVCQRAGFCLHSVTGVMVKLFVEQIVVCLRVVLAPGCIARNPYDSGALVLHIFSASHDVWLHIGYGNLSSYEFTALPLVLASELLCRLAAAVGEVSLVPRTDIPLCGVGNLWQACKNMKFFAISNPVQKGWGSEVCVYA
jgi:hypothetical protein